MLTAICRYGARLVPEAGTIVEECRRRGELVQGPAVAELESAVAARLGGGRAVSASYGRMAFFYVLKALDLPPGSEVIFPALTFWVVPEMARVAGLRPVFADVDPRTFNLTPEAVERAITPRTRAVVPTHVYGLPCDMDEILRVARAHGLKVVEDCAHALGAFYRGRPVGTFGDASFLSFQLLKPLNTFGGGMAFTRDRALGKRLATLAGGEPWPTEAEVRRRLRKGRLESRLIAPRNFTLLAFPLLWAASWIDMRWDVYLWEKVRSLDPFPVSYRRRYPNVQARLGLAALERLDDWNRLTRDHALRLTRALSGRPGVTLPPDPADRIHVYYQYCAYVPDRDAFVKRCLRRGLDVEYHHMDVCSDYELFGDGRVEAPGARRTGDAAQVPIHASLSDAEMEAVIRRVAAALPAPVRAEAAPVSR